MPKPKFNLIPRVNVRRGGSDPGREYTDVDIHFLHLLISVRVDDRGASLHVDEKFTARFLECFIDKPTGEISCRLSYKKE